MLSVCYQNSHMMSYVCSGVKIVSLELTGVASAKFGLNVRSRVCNGKLVRADDLSQQGCSPTPVLVVDVSILYPCKGPGPDDRW